MIINNNPGEDIPLMFTAPNVEIKNSKKPLLYLLRIDLETQYGKEFENPSELKAPLLTSLGILIGIDLLTKFWLGVEKTKMKDIESFLEKICGVSNNEAIALTQLRNSLAHGYRLKIRREKCKNLYSFILDDNPSQSSCIIDNGSFNYTINIWRLKELFLKAMNEYRELLKNDSALIGKFMIAKASLGEFEIK